MTNLESSSRVSLSSILFLTDFSEPSEAALAFATSIARGYGAKILALHVFIPPNVSPTVREAIDVDEEHAKAEMSRLESQLSGLPYETIVEQGFAVWPAVEQVIKDCRADLIVLGTHGRTGTERLLLGSVAEEIFRRSSVPVLTVGPGVRSRAHSGGRFHRILFATDFTEVSLAAAPFAFSLAQQNQARLMLLHVLRHPRQRADIEKKRLELSVAESFHRLYEAVPKNAEHDLTPEIVLEYGKPADGIVETAKQSSADLIVLGIRAAKEILSAITQVKRATAHKVVAHATSPVLTVRQ